MQHSIRSSVQWIVLRRRRLAESLEPLPLEIFIALAKDLHTWLYERHHYTFAFMVEVVAVLVFPKNACTSSVSGDTKQFGMDVVGLASLSAVSLVSGEAAHYMGTSDILTTRSTWPAQRAWKA